MPEPVRTEKLQAYLLLLITTFCWGMNAVLGRLAVGEIQPMLLVTLRWVVVVLVVLPIAWRSIITDWQVLRPRLIYMSFMGSTLSLFSVLFYSAAHTTTAVNMGILQGSVPVLILLAAWVVYRRPVSALQLLAVAITLLGVVIVATAGRWQQVLDFSFRQGDVYMLMACLVYAVYALGLSKKPVTSPFSFFAMMVVAALVFSLPFAAMESIREGWVAPSVRGWMLVLITGIFTSLVAQMLFIRGVGLIGPGRAGVFVNLVPIFAAVLAVLVLSESFEMFHAVALALVLGGIALSEWASTGKG